MRGGEPLPSHRVVTGVHSCGNIAVGGGFVVGKGVAMNAVKDMAVAILDECRAAIQANMAKHYSTSKGERWINASGRSSAAFKVLDDGDRVLLVYRGDNVAPLFSIQDGTTGIPPVSVIEEWMEEKGVFPPEVSPWAIRANMKKRGGSERHTEPQKWVIQPEVDKCIAQLRSQLPPIVKSEVRSALFSR